LGLTVLVVLPSLVAALGIVYGSATVYAGEHDWGLSVRCKGRVEIWWSEGREDESWYEAFGGREIRSGR
jgi:hypothetical protein